MTKENLLQEVSKETGHSQKEIDKVIKSFCGVLLKGFKKGEGIRLNEIGTFKVRDRAAHIGRNPKDGSELQIAATRQVSFKLAKFAREEMKGATSSKKAPVKKAKTEPEANGEVKA
jgi:nucleoid DNA-binding protein